MTGEGDAASMGDNPIQRAYVPSSSNASQAMKCQADQDLSLKMLCASHWIDIVITCNDNSEIVKGRNCLEVLHEYGLLAGRPG
ncbi:hypothetical protein Tco_0763125 [Tanacetum coccineum]